MAHILFISRYFSPEKAAAAVCVSETAKRLVKLGHQVTVLTTVPNYPTGIIPTEYRGRLVYKETLEGVQVVRVWSYISPNEGFLRRILAQLSFGCIAPFLAHKSIGHPDVIIVESPPLFNVMAARMLVRRKRCPLIFWVADLWPESAVRLGILRNRLLIRLSEWLEWSTYQRASIIWVVTGGMRETLIRRGLPPEKLLLITNGVDTARFRPLQQADARAELNWGDRFILLYAGNHGLVYAMTILLDAAERLQEFADIHMILAGDGVRKAELVAEARKRGLKNVTFLNSVSHDRMPILWAAADICLIPFRKMPLLEDSLPIKMFEVMACARPFILGAEGIARHLAEQQANAGIVVEPENVEALVSAILYLRTHPWEAEAQGMRGREYVKSHFDYDLLTGQLDTRIAELIGKEADNSLPEASLPSSISATPIFISAATEKSLINSENDLTNRHV